MIHHIPGWMVAIATFPGIFLHEIAHQLMCNLLGLPVLEVHYFALFGESAGHVRYKSPDDFYVTFLVSMAPLILNSLVCMLFLFPFLISYQLGTNDYVSLGMPFLILKYVLAWIGISAGFWAMPSPRDLENMEKLIRFINSRIGRKAARMFCFFFKIFHIHIISFFIRLFYVFLIPSLLVNLVIKIHTL